MEIHVQLVLLLKFFKIPYALIVVKMDTMLILQIFVKLVILLVLLVKMVHKLNVVDVMKDSY